MSNDTFMFKQFSICHQRSAMKVGTDGVLLGSWCNISSATQILDIGAGSGLLSLMAAQRNAHALITGIEIDTDAAMEATDNAKGCKWNDRVTIIHDNILDYAQNTNFKYDHIISNPPYFTDSLTCPQESRSTARHTKSLNWQSLLECSRQLLAENGLISIISPYDCKDIIEQSVNSVGLHCSRITMIYPTKESKCKRVLWELKAENTPLQTSTLIIEKSRHIYTEEYISLTHDFYLKM